jgi:superfamily I DNA/RNA helicase
VCSEEDTRDILDHILTNEIETTLLQDKSQRDPQGQVWNASSLATKIAIMKDRGVLPQQAPTKILREIYDKYQSMLKGRQMIDFEDMSSKIAEHLEEHPEDRAKVQGLYSDIMVDEFQDVNLSQARLFRAITPEKNPNITMVGDPLQAIYGFRGGDNSFITPQSTRERYGNNSTFINLEDNFRSMPNIVNFALMIEDTGLKKGQARRHVVSSRGDAKNAGSPIDVFLSDAPDNAASKEAQLDYMVERMQKLNIEQQIQMTKGIGILCRTNEEVKEVKEYLQKKNLLVAKNKSESRDTDDEEPVSATAEMPGIWVSTLHASKGLEFGTVFMFNVVNGILPHSTATSSLEKPEDLEKSLDEERRLFYTGATRAKNNLIITSSQKSQSIFLKEAIKRANELGRKAMLNVHGT